MSDEKQPVFQGLMDQAYGRWQANSAQVRAAREAGDETAKEWSKQDFLDQLYGDEMLAIPLGNLIYQVQNGGWSQWMGNGYASPYALSMLRVVLKQIGTPAALKTQELIERFERLTDGNLSDQNWYPDEDDSDEFQEQESALSREFYEVDDQLLDDAEKLFASRKG